MDNYERLYQNYDDQKLKNVLAEGYKYTEDALVAAKNECQNRGIDVSEIVKKTPERNTKSNEFFQKVKSAVIEYVPSFKQEKKSNSFEVLDSDQIKENANRSADRLHKKLIGAFVIIGIYNIVINFSLFWYMITDSQAEWDFQTTYILVPMFSLPLFTVLFFSRKKIGWGFILFQFVEAVISNSFTLISYGIYFFGDMRGYEYSNFGYIFILLIALILSVVITVYITYLLSKRKIRSTIFSVSDNQYFQSMFASIVFGGLLFYVFYQSSIGSGYAY